MCHLRTLSTAGPELMRRNRYIYYRSSSKVGEPEAVSSQMKECDDLRGGSHDIPGICLSPLFDSVGSDGFRETRV